MAKHKFKIDDKVVVVKAQLEAGIINAAGYVPAMQNAVGKAFIISAIGQQFDGNWYRFNDSDWAFDERQLELYVEPVKEEEPKAPPVRVLKFNVGDRVKVVKACLGGQYGGFDGDMQGEEGKVFTIAKGDFAWKDEEGYRFKENGQWNWDVRCLRRVRKAPVAALIEPVVEKAAIIAPVRPKETPFIVGDVVICIDSGTHLKKGGVYVVTSCKYGFTKIEGDDKRFYNRRFELKEAAPVPKKEEKKKPLKLTAIAKFMSVLQEAVEKEGGAGTCSYGKLYADGTHKLQIQDACHARIPSYEVDTDIICLSLNVQGHEAAFKRREEEGSKGALKKYHNYIEYIINYSPWSVCFHSKGLSHALKHGVGMDVEQKMEHLVSAAIALREGSEYSKELDVFNHLLSLGYSGNVSYLMARSFTMNVDKNTFSYKTISNGHKTLHPQQDSEELFAFFRNGATKKKDDNPYRTHHKAYFSIYNHIAQATTVKGGSISDVIKKISGAKEYYEYGEQTIVPIPKFLACADFLATVLDKE